MPELSHTSLSLFMHAVDTGRMDVRTPYNTARWQRLRLEQLRRQPLCEMCLPAGCVPATVCDHIEPHRGDREKFWSGPFQSLCAEHHNSDKQRIEKGGRPKVRIAADGWTLDPAQVGASR